METATLHFGIVNWITVLIMVTLGFAILGWLAQAWHNKQAS